MSINASNINILWGSLIVEELIRNGIDYFCLSPGSRSTPLTAAVAENSRAKHIICFDERGAAFHALGYARAAGKPAVLICTSGTAGANYFPAIIEAAVDGVPMIVLTADRPPELRDSGANQTIDQVKLFGKYVNWDFDLPCPDEKVSARMVLSTVDQAVYRSRRDPPGPVHINCMFREPLAPVSEPVRQDYLQTLLDWPEKFRPFTSYELSLLTPPSSAVSQIAEMIDQTKRGIILAGKLSSPQQARSILELSQKINWPIFPDVNSGLRFQQSKNSVITCADQMLVVESMWEKFAPETVLQFGSRIVSKRVMEFLERVQPKNYVQILQHPHRHDPQHQVSLRIEADPEVFCKLLLMEVSAKSKTPYLATLVESANVVDSLLDTYVQAEQNVTEVSTARIISSLLPQKSALFLASSMPVRDMDMFAASTGAIIPVAANRGASGIDGTLASAAGFAVGHGLPVTVIIGDLAMIHDLNSLHLLRAIKQSLVIVVINNNGSGIFSFLPVAQFENIFEEYFGTPHNLSFERAAQMFDIDYFQPGTNAEFQNTYQDALMGGRTTIIEIRTDRKQNLELHQKIQERIRIALQP